MADIEKWAEVGKELTSLLRLKTPPLAIKMAKTSADFPERTRFPSQHLGQKALICQAVSMAGIYGWTVGMKASDCVICPGPVIFGLGRLKDEKDLANYWAKHLPFFETPEAAQTLLSSVGRLKPREYVGMVFSPLEWTRVVPDVVMVHCNPAQIMRLIHAWIYKEGKMLNTSQGAILATCQGIISPLLTGQPQALMPGVGDRVAGGLQDDEVIFSFPAAQTERIMDGLKVRPNSIRYPVPISSLRVPGLVPYRDIEDRFEMFES